MEESDLNQPKRHQTVPRFYLHGFAKNDTIQTIPLDGRQPFITSINNASVKKNFYTIPNLEDEYVFERKLGELEKQASKAIKKVKNGSWPLPPEHRAAVAVFISLGALRGEGFRDQIRILDSHYDAYLKNGDGAKKLQQLYVDSGRTPPTDAEAAAAISEITGSDNPLAEVNSQRHAFFLANFLQDFALLILSRPWTLYTITDGSLITGDNPLGIGPPIEDIAEENRTGVAIAQLLTFPVSRTHGILMGPITTGDHIQLGQADHFRYGTSEFHELANPLTLASCSECIFHHPDDGKFAPSDEEIAEHEPLTVIIPDRFKRGGNS